MSENNKPRPSDPPICKECGKMRKGCNISYCAVNNKVLIDVVVTSGPPSGWSNALNKPWYYINDDLEHESLDGTELNPQEALDVMNDSTEQAILNAAQITVLKDVLLEYDHTMRCSCISGFTSCPICKCQAKHKELISKLEEAK